MEKNLILLIETSTEACSVALADGATVIAEKYLKEPKVHASMLAPLTESLLTENGLTVADLAAVAVSEGPGSYTGLRVGVSTAKGLCFGASKPLIAVSTLQTLAYQCKEKVDAIVPMIDARRMEVFTATYDSTCRRISEIEPKVLDESSYADLLKDSKVMFIGDGAEKFSKIVSSPNALFDFCSPRAAAMAVPAAEAYTKKEFKDVAYFEPFYLKDFIVGVSKKSVL